MAQERQGPDDSGAVPPKGPAGGKPRRKAPKPAPAGQPPLSVPPDIYQAEFDAQHQQLLDSQEDLAAALARNRSLYDNAPMGYVSLDRHGCMREINLTAARWIGIDRQQLLGKPLANHIVPEDREAVRSHVNRCAGGQELVVTEVRLERQHQRPLPVLLESVARRGEDLYLTTITDLTERRRAQDNLRESESRFRQIAESIHEVFWLGMPDWSEVLYISPAYEEIWGRPCETLYENPLSWLESIVPEDREAVRATTQAWDKEHPAPVIVAPDYRIVRPDGTQRWISARTFPIVDSRGRLWRIAGTCEDITLRKQAQLRLELTVRVLELLNRAEPLADVLRQVLAAIRECTGLEGAGIRLREGDDFRYAQTDGLPGAFAALENSLLRRDAAGRIMTDAQGNPILECVCGEVLLDRTDARVTCFSAGGSFCTNSTTDLLRAPPKRLRQIGTRNRCHEAGYESVALIPLRAEGVIVGLLHLVDRRRDQFPPEVLRFFEGLGAGLGAALHRTQLAEAVHGSERITRALIEATNDVAMLLSPDGMVLTSNQAHAKALHRDLADIIGRKVKDLLPPALAESRMQQVRKAVESGQPVEFVDRRGDQWIDNRMYPVLDDRGQVVQLAVYGRDITEHKLAEQALQQSESRFRTLVEDAPTAIGIGRSGVALYANKRYLQLFGFESLDQLIGQPLADHWSPEWRGLIDSRARKRTQGLPVPDSYEAVALRKDGSRFPAQVAVTKVDLPDGPATLAFITDLTERKRAEEAIRQSEEQYRTLFENMLEGCAYCKVLYDDQRRPVDWVYLAVNKVFEPLTGMVNVVGKRVTDLIPGIRQSNPDLFEAYGRVAATGQPTELETHIPALGLWAHISVFCPAPDHFVAVFERINERRQNEERVATYQRQLRSLGSKLAAAEENERRRIAADLHDNVVQSLAAARLRLQTIGTEALAPGAAAPFNEALRLLHQAVQDTRSLMFELCPPPLYELGLEAALEWLTEKVQKEHALTVTLTAEPAAIPLDTEVRGILFRAVRELLQNVVKHAHAQTVEVSVHRQGGRIRVEVRDDGRGFGPKTAASGGGLGGFGLFEVRERLDYIGGSLQIQSNPGSGTRAVLLAPLAVAGPNKEAEAVD